MPPVKYPKPPSGFFSPVTAWLLKLKTLLNLIISDFLRIIFAFVLFFAIILITLWVLSYHLWFPTLNTYLELINEGTSTPMSSQ